MKLQHFIAATGILLSSNVVASAQFSLRSLVDGLTSKMAPAEENNPSQDVELPSSIDAPSLQEAPSPNQSSVLEKIDLDSLPMPTLSDDASPDRPFQNDTLIHRQHAQHFIPQPSPNHAAPTKPDAAANPSEESSLSHSPVNLHFGQVEHNCPQPCHSAGTQNRCGSHHGQEKPIVCLDSPNLPPPVSITGYYRTPIHYNNLWGDYLDEQVVARRKAYRSLLAPPKSVYESQCSSPQGSTPQCGSSN